MSVRPVHRSLRRRDPARTGGFRRWVAGLTVVPLVVSLLVGAPVEAAAPAPAVKPVRPPVEKLDVHGGPVSGRAWAQRRVKDAPVPAPVWPAAGTARVEVGPARGLYK
ncbi:hypothetical protein QTQ03_16395 [Micromonospora sp. WMMA1363]|uniref:hypothetical protein n=1 Tax=Micromonospora sp. WMMA1363 TaxID=3053985 RepID=UPI00259C7A42|nr:hypothetical protein [Micromonospora sp. WMMA1363]MDM4721101.1 hypothetical protein [Micromonospora sp. WMMA1363]